jgi:hypothetical protein
MAVSALFWLSLATYAKLVAELMLEKGDRECLARAVATRGFTLEFFTKWLDKYHLPDRAPPPKIWEIFPLSESGEVFLQKRWLRPEDEQLLINLLRHRKITIMPKFLSSVFPTAAILEDALRLFWHPRVTLKWPMEIMDHFGEQNRMHYMADGKCEVLREVLCSAVRRPDVTAQSLNCLLSHRTYETTHESWSDIYDVALHTGKRNVIEWAVHHGFVPTSEQLRRILLHLGYVIPV